MKDPLSASTSRRRVLQASALGGITAFATPALAQALANLGLPGSPSMREMTTVFPQKGPMILQRNRPPLLETPMEVFDGSVFTPNDRFFVRWHWAVIPPSVDVDQFRLKVHGAVERPLSISLAALLNDLPRVEIAAVNQCSGNSRGFFQPPVPGGEWGHGAMGNAKWMGVRLRDVLDKAGVKAGARQVRFSGMDEPVVPTGPDFKKSLAIDHARDGEVMLAFAMNGEALPLLNGFPLRLIVPGWFSTYWVKMLSDIEVLDHADENFWMAKAYKLPDNRWADVSPGQTGYSTVPISTMVPRAWITNLSEGASVRLADVVPIRGIAMGGTRGVAKVDISPDGGRHWYPTELSPDEGRYSFRRWQISAKLPHGGKVPLTVRCTNSAGETQPMAQNWNPGGYRRAGAETITINAA
ncbi:molybdopterin-dependent oxidoreductase [Novosphingopyxis iocasae]|uniref:molybdopterin-dependent oxidoreductase n=1 Tax=Novosphingopyxis iocasae TaxID=2762729 RepID=UPI0016510947|nr:molybdopterin-dependent oxidoreductase [Novosphingopyxis iocasae]